MTLKTLLEAYLDNQQKGLLLLDMPTGSGKTYAVIDYIASHIQTLKAQQRKILFITPMKKNLPFDELKARLNELEKSHYYDEEVLVVKNTVDMFRDHFDSCKYQITKCFDFFPINQLDRYLKLYQQPIFKGEAEDEIRVLANQLAFHIRQYFLENTDSIESRLELIKHDSDWQWVTKLYPASLTMERSVIFMTVSKFITPYKTLVEPSVPFDQLFKDYHVTLFIDEIDSAKSYIQKHIIKQSLDNSIELIPTVNQIASRLQESSFPSKLVNPHVLTQQKANPKEIEQGFREGASDIVEKYQLQLSLLTEDDFNHDKRSFIFYDTTEYFLGNAHNKRLLLNPDYANHTLWIHSIPYKPNEHPAGMTVNQVLAESRKYINFFKGGINMLANNYYYAQQNFTGISPDSAIETYLDFFRLSEKTVKNLTNEIQYNRLIKKWAVTDLKGDFNTLTAAEKLYEYGFVYHMIVDSDRHAGRSRIQSYNFPCTAEIYLASWCRDFMVVGVSATANVETRLGNFDWHYIAQKLLKDNHAQFFKLTLQQQAKLDQQFETSKQHYERVKLQTHWHEPLDSNAQQIEVKERYLTLFNNDERYYHDIESILNAINELITPTPDNAYHQAQYFKIFELWLAYLKQEIKAFLLLFNRGYQDKSLVLIKELCQKIAIANGFADRIADNEIMVILGADTDQHISDVHKKLATGQSCFVLSTYQTLGAGKNIQYVLPDNDNNVIQINDFNRSKEVDFDGIYLDRPTNVLVNVNSNDPLSEENFVNYIYQLEYLQVSGLTQKDFKTHLEKGFKAFDTGKSYFRSGAENIYKTKDYKKQVMQILIQALGRICRTNLKRPVIHLHLDQTILQNWTDELNDIPLLPEFKRIQQDVHQQTGDWVNHSDDLASSFAQSSETIKAQIDNILQKFAYGSATPNLVKEWLKLRELCLKYPQYVSQEQHKKLYQIFDNVVNRYYFRQQKDYQYMTVRTERFDGCQTIGLDSSRLHIFMQHTGLKHYFEQQGYATYFEPSAVWLNPVMFNNIYKGALGEVCGKFLWEDYGLPPLQDMPLHHYEKFDFQVSPTIHVDFKHWQETWQDGELNRTKIFEKMDILESKLVFIINMIDKAGNRPLYHIYYNDDNSKEIVEIANFLSNTRHLQLIDKIQERITAHAD